MRGYNSIRIGLILLGTLILVGGAFGAGESAAQAESERPSLEYQVKASMLYNFIQFAEWPPEVLPPGADIDVCVVGRDRFKSALAPLETELVSGHRIRIVRLAEWRDETSCHLAFFDSEQAARMNFAVLQKASALTVGESAGFLDQGGVINFVIQSGKLRFEVSQKSALQSRIDLSAKLLQLAVDVRKN